MENKEIARLLGETADLMEIAGEDSFRIRSYRNGATAIEGNPERVSDILKDPQRKVTDIPGIGKGLALVVEELVNRSSCERRASGRFPWPAARGLRCGRRASTGCPRRRSRRSRAVACRLQPSLRRAVWRESSERPPWSVDAVLEMMRRTAKRARRAG